MQPDERSRNEDHRRQGFCCVSLYKKLHTCHIALSFSKFLPITTIRSLEPNSGLLSWSPRRVLSYRVFLNKRSITTADRVNVILRTIAVHPWSHCFRQQVCFRRSRYTIHISPSQKLHMSHSQCYSLPLFSLLLTRRLIGGNESSRLSRGRVNCPSILTPTKINGCLHCSEL